MQLTGKRRRLILTRITVAMAVVAAGCGSSRDKQVSPSVAAAATSSQATRTFTSQWYGFRVKLSKRWSENDAQVNWKGGHLEGLDSPVFARFSDPAGSRTLVAAAAPVTRGMELAGWRAAMVRAAPNVCSESPSAKQTTLGDEPALTWTATCTDGYHVNKIAAVHARRGYIILLAAQTATSDAATRGVFDSIRKSFRFTR